MNKRISTRAAAVLLALCTALPMAQARAGFERLDAGDLFGKLVLTT